VDGSRARHREEHRRAANEARHPPREEHSP
jgi:hypothetical protein